MTREDFYDRVTSWYGLLEVAEEYDLKDEFDDIVDDDHIRERIQERADNIGYGDDWTHFASWVSQIPRGFDYLSYDDVYDDFEALDDDNLDSRRDDLFARMLDDGHIEEDQEREEPDSEEDDEDVYADPEEAFPIDSLVSMCYADVRVIRDNQQAGA